MVIKIYTEGNKPTPAAIGALGNSGSQTMNVAQGKFTITGNGGYGHIDVAGGFHTRGDSNDIWFERSVKTSHLVKLSVRFRSFRSTLEKYLGI